MRAIGALLLVASCATAPRPHTVHRISSVVASYDETWSAIVDLFGARSWPIKTIDKASGIIATESLVVSDDLADCGGAGIFTTGRAFGTLSITVRDAGGGNTAVTVNARFRQARSLGDVHQIIECASTGAIETRIRDSLAERYTIRWQ